MGEGGGGGGRKGEKLRIRGKIQGKGRRSAKRKREFIGKKKQKKGKI